MSKTYIIYQICCDDLPDFIYIGSTDDIDRREKNHKSRCYNEKDKRYNLKIYQTIRDNGGWENWEMLQVELYNCNDKTEALKREQYWIDVKKSNLNSVRAYQTEEQKKEQKKEYDKKYRTKNADKRNEKFNCECGGKYVYTSKSHHLKTKKHLDYLNLINKSNLEINNLN